MTTPAPPDKRHRFVPSTSIGESKRICDECGQKRSAPIHQVESDS